MKLTLQSYLSRLLESSYLLAHMHTSCIASNRELLQLNHFTHRNVPTSYYRAENILTTSFTTGSSTTIQFNYPLSLSPKFVPLFFPECKQKRGEENVAHLACIPPLLVRTAKLLLWPPPPSSSPSTGAAAAAAMPSLPPSFPACAVVSYVNSAEEEEKGGRERP